jgi:hypothetical protein
MENSNTILSKTDRMHTQNIGRHEEGLKLSTLLNRHL